MRVDECAAGVWLAGCVTGCPVSSSNALRNGVSVAGRGRQTSCIFAD